VAFSCRRKKKDDIDPFLSGNEVCPLIGLVKDTGEPLRDYEYVGNQLARIYSIEDNVTTVMSFRYDEKNVIKTMEVETGSELEKLVVTFLYDEKGRVNQTSTSVAGIPFLKNVFIQSDGKITSVITTVELFGQSISGLTRLVYKGKNVSEVYSSIDGEPEKLAFVGEKYDDKPQFHPAAYKTAALGFVGIANNFFSFFGENNLISGIIYDENGKVDQKTNIIYTYDKKGLPTSSQALTEKNGVITTQAVKYEFKCD
jgi:hypothetical protein